MAQLHEWDDVAYVRFASVYRQFQDTSDFMQELKELLESKKRGKKAGKGRNRTARDAETRRGRTPICGRPCGWPAEGRAGLRRIPLVGAVVVRGGQVVGAGYHQKAGGPHAERIALAQAGRKARGATLYVNLEPCNHTGRTPPCTEAILESGIKQVVFGMEDPNPAGQPAAAGAYLRSQGIEVRAGSWKGNAGALNEVYCEVGDHRLPFCHPKSRPEPGREDRHLEAAIPSGSAMNRPGPGSTACGVGWMESWWASERCWPTTRLLTPRISRKIARTPLRVIVDPRLRIPLSARLFSDSGTGADCRRGRGARKRKRRNCSEKGAEVVFFAGSGRTVRPEAFTGPFGPERGHRSSGGRRVRRFSLLF